MYISSHWPTAAQACLVAISPGREGRDSLPTPMPMAPDETRMTSCPAFFRSLSTLTRSSVWRMFSRPVECASVEVPTLTTMRIKLTLSHFLCLVVGGNHRIGHRAAEAVLFQHAHALNGAAAGAAHRVLELTGVFSAFQHQLGAA